MKVKQGHTLYQVWLDWPTNKFKVSSIFMDSHKAERPREGIIVTKYPVDLVRIHMKNVSSALLYKSRRKAETRCKQENRNMHNPMIAK